VRQLTSPLLSGLSFAIKSVSVISVISVILPDVRGEEGKGVREEGRKGGREEGRKPLYSRNMRKVS
jgi:hypothetical protein